MRATEEAQRYREAVARAKQDHAEHVGKILRAEWVQGYKGEDSGEVRCDPPAFVRVLPTDDESLAHDTGEWLDPYWDVELVGPHPALEGYRSLWIYGPSYPLYEGGEADRDTGWTVALGQEPPTAWEKAQRNDEPYREAARNRLAGCLDSAADDMTVEGVEHNDSDGAWVTVRVFIPDYEALEDEDEDDGAEEAHRSDTSRTDLYGTGYGPPARDP